MAIHIIVAATALLALERATEIVVSWAHAARLRVRGGRYVADDGFGMLVFGQACLFAGVALEYGAADWSGVGWWTWPMLALVGAAMLLRWWVVRTLGDRWTLRVIVVPGLAPVTGGPYRYLRHPNYLAVVVEVVAFPLAFGAIVTAVLVSAINGVALWRRIRSEERALESVGGYEEAFEGRRRLVP